MNALFYTLAIFLSAPDSTEKIHWSDSVPVTWADFKGAPSDTIDADALTYTGITYSFNWQYSFMLNQKVLEFKVFCFMEPQRSWVRKKRGTDYLLEHERRHFDITELHARYLRKAFGEYRPGALNEIQTDMETIFNAVMDSYRTMQAQYDRDTAHSRNRANQAQWDKFIKEQLAEYEKYAR